MSKESAYLIKIDRGVDLTEGLVNACSEKGVASAYIASAVGSLEHAVLEHESVEGPVSLEIPGPGLELAALSGLIEIVDGSIPGLIEQSRPIFSGIVVDKDGCSYGGRLVPGKNPLCITLEAILVPI